MLPRKALGHILFSLPSCASAEPLSTNSVAKRARSTLKLAPEADSSMYRILLQIYTSIAITLLEKNVLNEHHFFVRLLYWVLNIYIYIYIYEKASVRRLNLQHVFPKGSKKWIPPQRKGCVTTLENLGIV